MRIQPTRAFQHNQYSIPKTPNQAQATRLLTASNSLRFGARALSSVDSLTKVGYSLLDFLVLGKGAWLDLDDIEAPLTLKERLDGDFTQTTRKLFYQGPWNPGNPGQAGPAEIGYIECFQNNRFYCPKA